MCTATRMAWLLLLISVVGSPLAKATVIYSSRTSFEDALGETYYESYGPGSGYQTQDYDDSSMSAVKGQVEYQATGQPDTHYISFLPRVRWGYCAGGCGSVLLNFESMSIADAGAVFGVSFFMYANFLSEPYPPGDPWPWPYPQDTEGFHSFVTFGDGSTADYELPIAGTDTYVIPYENHPSFWGITSPLGIKSIHIGAENGAATTEGRFVLERMTVGADPLAVTSPGTVLLMLFGFGMLFSRARASQAPVY